VVIRARDEVARLGLCLEALREQDHPGPAEVVLVDSGSTDGTLETARRYPVRILEIAPEEFTYASALNRGLAAARAPLAALLSAHVVPVDRGWLQALERALEDPRVAGAYSREVPWPDADLYERVRLEGAFPPYRMVKALELAGEEGDRRCLRLYEFSNAAALIRRARWEERPFRELPYAEDIDWAHWALGQGHWIVYEPAARVRHSHCEPLGPRAAREVKSQLALAEIFSYRPSLHREILKNLKASLDFALRAARSPITLREKLYWAAYALGKWGVFARGWMLSLRRTRCASY
jgi:glycosyltransferase involved in cell wall biosynthesis